jgi:glutathione S-transferase
VFRFTDFERPYYAFRRGEEGAWERLAEMLAWLDRVCERSAYLTGRSFGLADVAYLPWVLRARDVLDIALEPWPALAAWVDRVSERPSVAAELDIVAAL